MQKISPFLWFNNNAEEAVNFYVSLFKNSKITKIVRTGEAGPGPSGSVLTVEFELDGLHMVALNGGSYYTLTPAFSLSISCESQAEVDHYWDSLVAGGKPSQCGWLEDKFGLSWQVVPTALPRLISDPDPKRAARAMQAMMKMVKLNIAELEKAADG